MEGLDKFSRNTSKFLQPPPPTPLKRYAMTIP